MNIRIHIGALTNGQGIVWATSSGVEIASSSCASFLVLDRTAASDLVNLLENALIKSEAIRKDELPIDALLRAVRDAELHQFSAGACIAVVEAAKAVARSR